MLGNHLQPLKIWEVTQAVAESISQLSSVASSLTENVALSIVYCASTSFLLTSFDQGFKAERRILLLVQNRHEALFNSSLRLVGMFPVRSPYEASCQASSI